MNPGHSSKPSAASTRRTFLKTAGTVSGGFLVSSTTATAASTKQYRYIVHASPSTIKASSVTPIHLLSEVGLAIVKGSENEVNQLGKHAPDISLPHAALKQRLKLQNAPAPVNDPYYSLQWDKQSQDIPTVLDVTTGSGARVAVIDTGIAAGHPDLAQSVNTNLSKNFTTDSYGVGAPIGGSHGTTVAGIIGANASNQTGVIGTAPEAELVDCRVFSPRRSGTTLGDVLAAITYSSRINCDVANLSLGAYPLKKSNNGHFYRGVFNKTTEHARRNGTLLVAAAGNQSADLQHDKNKTTLPGEAASVLSVSATGPIGFDHGASELEKPVDTPARYTNYGTNAIDLAAPGGNYATGFPQGWYYDMVYNTSAFAAIYNGKVQNTFYGYTWSAGTSMAAPQVTGAAALVKTLHPSYNANQVRSTLERTASRNYPGKKPYYGRGMLSTKAAVSE